MDAQRSMDTVDVLKHLVETCRDREESYRSAQEGTNDPGLRELCAVYITQSVELRRELEDALRRYGIETRQSGTPAGAMFRSWMAFKAAVANDDEATILSDCEREEDAASRNYRVALQVGLPSEVSTLISRHADQLEATHRHIQTLRDRAQTGSNV
jgi:uncharacterized protein (TIGR02284 family)